MPELLGPTNPVPGYDQQPVRINPPAAGETNVLNTPVVDPTRVVRPDNRAEQQDSGDATGSQALRYDSNFATFLQRLRGAQDLPEYVLDILRLDGREVSSGIRSGFAEELSQFLEFMNMDEGEVRAFLQNQLQSTTRFSGALFDALRGAYSGASSELTKSEILQFVRRYSDFASTPHLEARMLRTVEDMADALPGRWSRQLTALLGNLRGGLAETENGAQQPETARDGQILQNQQNQPETARNAQTLPNQPEAVRNSQTLQNPPETARDGQALPQQPGTPREGQTAPGWTELLRDGQTLPEQAETAQDGQTLPSLAELMRGGQLLPDLPELLQDGQTLPEQAEAPRDGQTLPEQAETAQDGQTLPEQPETPRDGQVLPNQTELPRDGRTLPNQPEAARNSQTLPARPLPETAQDSRFLSEQPAARVSTPEDRQANLSLLREQLFPMISQYVKMTHDYGAARNLLSILTLDMARYENGSEAGVLQSLRALSNAGVIPRGIAELSDRDLLTLLNKTDYARAAQGNSFADSLSRTMGHALKGEGGAELQEAFHQIMRSVLINESVYMPLNHVMLPVEYNGQMTFAEVWVDPDAEEEKRGRRSFRSSDERTVRVLLKLDVSSLGAFDLLINSRGRDVSLSVACPAAVSEHAEEVSAALSEILRRNGLTPEGVAVGQMQRPVALSEAFPKILERMGGLNVKI